MTGEKVQRKEGYSESAKYCVVPAFGHVFSLCDREEYNPDYNPETKTKWTLDVLPFVPATFQFKLMPDAKNKKAADSGVKKQFEIIKRLIHDNSISSIIHCGDSDREGEIIVRLILEQANNIKPVYRLWLPNQAEETIASALNDLKSDSKYDALANEGYARMYIDWLYGINLTRYASIKYGSLLRIGRVIGAIVKAICERDREIRNFIPKKYLVAVSKEKTAGIDVELTSKKKFPFGNMDDVKSLCADYNSLGAVIKDKKTENKVINSPKLFSQSSLQNTLSKRFGFSPDKTLQLVQSLYESGYVSYPRTPTEYLAIAEKEQVNKVIDAINTKGNNLVFKDNKRIFDDTKIESHSAITPTVKIPGASNFKSEDEKLCYETIYNRFCATFCPEDCIVSQTKLIIAVGDKEEFTLTGNVPVKNGWKAYDKPDDDNDKGKQEKELPPLNIGDNVNIKFLPVEKQTTPPKHYTVETLNNYLRNPFADNKKVAKENDDEEYRNLLDGLEIGTEATRSGIIKTAIVSGYIKLTKSTYTIEQAGERLVDSMSGLGIDMSKEKTAMMGKAIKDVYKGERNTTAVLQDVQKELNSIIGSGKEIQRHERPATEDKETFGNCPLCGKPVIDTPKAYGCSSRCGFAIWKENKFLTNGKKKLTKTMVKKLLKEGKVKVDGLVSAKTGKEYSCHLVLEGKGNLKAEFGGK